jgi:formylglycine-generating enzyme required for sulfatase activity
MKAWHISIVMAWLGLAAAGRAGLGAADAPPAPVPGGVTANSIGMRLAYVPAGEFLMGSPPGEKGREDDETPHRVRLSRPFCIGATEVTQGQWRAVMGQRRGQFEGDSLPVEDISWNDAVEFCKKLSQKEGRTYRLPTEAEWEYACRAGDTGRSWGAARLDEAAWYDENSDGRTHPVARKKPNAWGLYDALGNVAEWCADFFGPYPAGDATDPAGPAEGKARVVRGGSWASLERGCRAASRASTAAPYQLKFIGFRVVMELPG